ncbi:uncharacterized protein [Typha angustifolia]|uniref:uncharacterized protein n=1 Tax=Typha angustifolia TaxID=59011 RepID=UPI003C2E0F08
MDWYLVKESDDLLVPSDGEILENLSCEDGFPFLDDWCPWVVTRSKSLQSTEKCFGRSRQTPMGNFRSNGQSVCVEDGEGTLFPEGDGSGISTEWRGSTSLDFSTRNSEKSFEGQPGCQLQTNTEQIDDIFFNSSLEEDVRNMEDPFESLHMFPDSMYSSSSFDNIPTAMVTDPQSHLVDLDRIGFSNDLEAWGSPLFTNDLSENLEKIEGISPSCMMLNESEISDNSFRAKDRVSTTGEDRLAAELDNPKCLEAMVLQELEDIMIQINKKTRICFRDSLYRLANNSKQQRNTNETTATNVNKESYFPQREGESSRLEKAEPMEADTNVIDRTVAKLIFNQPCSGSPDNSSLSAHCKYQENSEASGSYNSSDLP